MGYIGIISRWVVPKIIGPLVVMDHIAAPSIWSYRNGAIISGTTHILLYVCCVWVPGLPGSGCMFLFFLVWAWFSPVKTMMGLREQGQTCCKICVTRGARSNEARSRISL